MIIEHNLDVIKAADWLMDPGPIHISEVNRYGPLKQEPINVIAGLPDDADMEELMYRLYVLENIRRGQKDAEKGKTMPVEEVLRDIQSW